MFSGSSSTQQILADCTSIPSRAACLRCTHSRQEGPTKAGRWEPVVIPDVRIHGCSVHREGRGLNPLHPYCVGGERHPAGSGYPS